jgi:hypothetical protein
MGSDVPLRLLPFPAIVVKVVRAAASFDPDPVVAPAEEVQLVELVRDALE